MMTLARIIFILAYVFYLSAVAEERVCSSPPEYPGVTLMRHTRDRALFKCAEGLEAYSGSPVVRCAGGRWGNLTLQCQKKSCGSAGELLNGYFNYEGEVVFGAKAYPVCRDGYTVKGPKVIECGHNGWPNDLPRCEEGEVTCPAPKVSNSEMGIAREYSVSAVVTVKCSPGFQIKGEWRITCGSDGQWKPAPPLCVPAPSRNKFEVTCPAPKVSNSEMGIAREYNVSDVVTVKCSLGFQIKGEGQITCRSDGRWKPAPPLCVPAPSRNSQCGVPENLEGFNAKLAPKFSSQKSFAAGVKVYYVCDIGYVHSQGSKYRRCVNGQWSPLELKCRRRLCGSAGELLNGHYEYTGVEFGDSATAVCDEGHQLVGQATRNCLSRGWDGHHPVCEVVVCDDPPEVANAVITGYAEAPFEYRTMVKYRCLVGTFMGPSGIWCTKNGTWSSPLPQCKDITCTTPEIPNGAFVRSRSGRYLYRDVVDVHCNTRYTLVGPSSITCDERGQWAPELPKCKAWNTYRRG